MAGARRIDVHFHLIPQFYAEMVYAAGSGPAIGRYPDWSPELALEVMDRFEIETALTSLAQPGVQFCKPADAKTLARRCNDYAAELNARHGKRFGAFSTVSTVILFLRCAFGLRAPLSWLFTEMCAIARLRSLLSTPCFAA